MKYSSIQNNNQHMEIPLDIWNIIIGFISDPKTFYNAALVSKKFNEFCQKNKECKMKEFLVKKNVLLKTWESLSKFFEIPDFYKKIYEKVGMPCSVSPYSLTIWYHVLPNKKKHGKVAGYYNNGFTSKNKIFEAEFKDDVLDGEFIWYYNNGNLSFSTFIKKGKQHGTRREYLTNGSLANIFKY